MTLVTKLLPEHVNGTLELGLHLDFQVENMFPLG